VWRACRTAAVGVGRRRPVRSRPSDVRPAADDAAGQHVDHDQPLKTHVSPLAPHRPATVSARKRERVHNRRVDFRVRVPVTRSVTRRRVAGLED